MENPTEKELEQANQNAYYDETKLYVRCECETNETDDDSDNEARDTSNNYPPDMNYSLIN